MNKLLIFGMLLEVVKDDPSRIMWKISLEWITLFHFSISKGTGISNSTIKTLLQPGHPLDQLARNIDKTPAETSDSTSVPSAHGIQSYQLMPFSASTPLYQ